jgi:hypothetical protein
MVDKDVYESPDLVVVGTLSALTSDSTGSSLHFSHAALGSLVAVTTPPPEQTPEPTPGVTPTPVATTSVVEPTVTPGATITPVPGGGVEPTVTAGGSLPTPTPTSGGVTPHVTPGGTGGGGVPDEVGSTAAAPGGEDLPFTGLPLGPIAALGAALTGAGAALRRLTRKSG